MGDRSSLYSKKKEAAQGFHIKRGTGYYEKELFIEVMEEHRYFLDFGGIYEKSQVFVNGQLGQENANMATPLSGWRSRLL